VALSSAIRPGAGAHGRQGHQARTRCSQSSSET